MNESNTLGSDILIYCLQAALSLMFKALNIRSHFIFPVLGISLSAAHSFRGGSCSPSFLRYSLNFFSSAPITVHQCTRNSCPDYKMTHFIPYRVLAAVLLGMGFQESLEHFPPVLIHLSL